MKVKDPIAERAVIIQQPSKRPYGVKVLLHVPSALSFGRVEGPCMVSLHTGAFLTVTQAQIAPWEGGKKFVVALEGFSTAAAAEAAGRRLVQALLWMAVSLDSSLRLEYQSYEPAKVFERNRPRGLTAETYIETGYAPNTIFGEIQDAYKALTEPDERLLLSMEIFCAAMLETSQRSKFITRVSALEPLAKEAPLGSAVEAFMKDCVGRLMTEGSIPPETKEYLKERVRHLSRESIRQALRRMTNEVLPNNPDAPSIVDDAYALRSQIIHNGVPEDRDIDLESETRKISTIIREIYASLLNRSLSS